MYIVRSQTEKTSGEGSLQNNLGKLQTLREASEAQNYLFPTFGICYQYLHWPKPTRSQMAKEPVHTVCKYPPPGSQSRTEKRRVWDASEYTEQN